MTGSIIIAEVVLVHVNKGVATKTPGGHTIADPEKLQVTSSFALPSTPGKSPCTHAGTYGGCIRRLFNLAQAVCCFCYTSESHKFCCSCCMCKPGCAC